MSPPINLDGNTVDAITMDGDSVSEVTVDGSAVFSAIPDSVVLNATAENYDGSQFVSNIGPNIPDVGGDPSIVTDDINGFDAVQYQASTNDQSETTTTIASSTSIAIVATFQKSNLDDNAIVFDDPAESLSFALNDSSGGNDWVCYIHDSTGTEQKLNLNYGHDTNYHTYAFGIGSELFFSEDGDRKGSDANVTESDPLDGLNIANGGTDMAVTEISALDNFTASELTNEISRQRNKYGT